MIEFKVLIDDADVGTWSLLQAIYHTQGIDVLSNFTSKRLAVPVSQESVEKIQEEDELPTPVSLYNSVVEYCSCGKCWGNFVGSSRVPWIQYGKEECAVFFVNAKQGRYTPSKSCGLTKFCKKNVVRGYIYEAAPSQKDLQIRKKMEFEKAKMDLEVNELVLKQQVAEDKQAEEQLARENKAAKEISNKQDKAIADAKAKVKLSFDNARWAASCSNRKCSNFHTVHQGKIWKSAELRTNFMESYKPLNEVSCSCKKLCEWQPQLSEAGFKALVNNWKHLVSLGK
jgi:hypothetical protein